MLASLDDLLGAVLRLHPAQPPRPFQVLDAVRRVRAGEAIDAVAKDIRSSHARLVGFADAPDPVGAVLGVSLSDAAVEEKVKRARSILGQLLLGELAEQAFEKIYKETMGTQELAIEDDRSSRNDTDYRVLNGSRRPVFRINIKFHGTLFRNARDLVGLDPEDCFALATYKIHQGLQKQNNERLPYLFVIVSAPGLTGERVGAAIPDDFTHLVSLVHAARKVPRKRALEELVVGHLLERGADTSNAELQSFRDAIAGAEWRVLSARRADRLLREKLFERVYAVRVRAFARNYRNAELDMHFSLRDDLAPLANFLENLRERGLHGLVADLERGVL